MSDLTVSLKTLMLSQFVVLRLWPALYKECEFVLTTCTVVTEYLLCVVECTAWCSFSNACESIHCFLWSCVIFLLRKWHLKCTLQWIIAWAISQWWHGLVVNTLCPISVVCFVLYSVCIWQTISVHNQPPMSTQPSISLV